MESIMLPRSVPLLSTARLRANRIPLFGKFVFSWIKYLQANILIEKIYTVHVENLHQIFTPKVLRICSAIGQWYQPERLLKCLPHLLRTVAVPVVLVDEGN